MSIAVENEDEKWAQSKHCVATNKTKAIHGTHTKKRDSDMKKQEVKDEQ